MQYVFFHHSRADINAFRPNYLSNSVHPQPECLAWLWLMDLATSPYIRIIFWC
jgi:hypothetical protein